MNVELWGGKVFPYLRRKRLFACLLVLHQRKLQNRRDLVFNFGFWGIRILGLQPSRPGRDLHTEPCVKGRQQSIRTSCPNLVEPFTK